MWYTLRSISHINYSTLHPKETRFPLWFKYSVLQLDSLQQEQWQSHSILYWKICYLDVFEETVKVMGQSEASQSVLQMKDINFWD